MPFNLLDSIHSPADVKVLDRRELKQLAQELRAFVLDSVSRTGGHLSSNLGTVELTIALHHVFDLPHDRIIWDVGFSQAQRVRLRRLWHRTFVDLDFSGSWDGSCFSQCRC